MGHFAKVINGIVEEVIVARQSFIDTLPEPQIWYKTSYNTYEGVHYLPNSDVIDDTKPPLRGNFAGIGYTYDAINDVFYSPQPYPSWILNTNTWLWEAPTPMPKDGNNYDWDETSLSWIMATDNTLATN
jgi:hypothetical protein